jgi:predicted ATP-grasp superfamily ATP-dependent carboligase
MMESPNSPVLIVAADTIIGLTVARSLGRRGIPVYCAWSRPDALGRHSAFSKATFRLPDDGRAAVEAIREHARRWGVTHLVGISENHIALLNRYRLDLEREFTLLFPPQEVFRRATHKEITLEYARKAGVPAPKSSHPQSPAEVEQCRGLRFPVVLKMAHHEFAGAGAVFRHKSLRVETFEELKKTLAALPEGQYPMVQEYVTGQGMGISMLMRGGKALLAFQHRRVREDPPEGGTGVVCESMPLDPKLSALSERLLAGMCWDGVAMVEYRGDWRTGRYTLMEVNGRFWGSLPTAIHAGADFPYWLYRTSFPGAPAPAADYAIGIRARSLAGDTKWLLKSLHGGKERPLRAIAQYLAAFTRSMHYFMWAWDDPQPAMRNLLGRFLGAR